MAGLVDLASIRGSDWVRHCWWCCCAKLIMVWMVGRLALLVCPAFPLLRVPGRAGFGGGRCQAVAGGPVVNTAFQSVVHGSAQGQWAGRCSTRRRCGGVIRAGTA